MMERYFMIPNVEDRTPYPLGTIMRLIKTRFGNIDEALREYEHIFQHAPGVVELMREEWDKIEEVTYEECFRQKTAEAKRTWFFFYGPVRMFHQLPDDSKTLIDTFVNQKAADRYNNGDTKGHTYELWDLDARTLKIPNKTKISVIRMWCPSTHKEYIIVIDPKTDAYLEGSAREVVPTMVLSPVPIKHITRIRRQGEVILFSHNCEDDTLIGKHRYEVPAQLYWDLMEIQT